MVNEGSVCGARAHVRDYVWWLGVGWLGGNMPDRVSQVFADVLQVPLEQISDRTSPDNTPQWDSLSAMNLVLALEDEFDLKLSTKEIVAMRSVAIVKRVLRERGAADV